VFPLTGVYQNRPVATSFACRLARIAHTRAEIDCEHCHHPGCVEAFRPYSVHTQSHFQPRCHTPVGLISFTNLWNKSVLCTSVMYADRQFCHNLG
jgi:hypothetical protein